jgi:hypothetical protein
MRICIKTYIPNVLRVAGNKQSKLLLVWWCNSGIPLIITGNYRSTLLSSYSLLHLICFTLLPFAMLSFHDFNEHRVKVHSEIVGDIEIYAKVGGEGPGLLLIHGYPQCHQ